MSDEPRRLGETEENWLTRLAEKRKRDIEFERDLTKIINKHSIESGSGTPDFVIAHFLMACLHAFERSLELRSNFFGGNLPPSPGNSAWWPR